MIETWIFVFGALVGSFVNVLIYRLPRDISVVLPRSKCDSCGIVIPWYQNIPIISYLYLRGKCRACHSSIGPSVLVVELLCAFAALYFFPGRQVFFHPELLWPYGYHLFAFYIFIAHFVIDLRHYLLLNKLNIALLVVALSYIPFHMPYHHWLYGAMIGYAGPYLIAKAFEKLKGQIGLGGGDIKLYGVLGVMLGPLAIIHNIFFSSLLGSIVGSFYIYFSKQGRDRPIPFGPFIIIVAIVQIYFPDLFSQINFLRYL